MEVDYDDDVTTEQVAAIDALVAAEFACGGWRVVEAPSRQEVIWQRLDFGPYLP